MPARVAVLGAGFIGARHLKNLATMPDVAIAGVADVDAARAHEQAAHYGTTGYGDWRVLLERERPDAAYLCLPPCAHGEPEEALIAAGMPFFTEKPLGTTPDLPERIAAQVQARGLLTSAGYHWRYLDTVDRAREIVQATPPRLAMGYWFDYVPPPAWWLRRERSGGQVVEQTTHIFDLVRHLLGEPQRVFAAACPARLAQHPEADIDAAASATLQYPSGAIAVISSTCVVHYPCRIGLWLYAEDLVVECREFSLRVERPQGTETSEPTVDPFLAEDRAFIHALRTGDRSAIRVPYAEALRTHRLVMRVVEAAQS
ncbi:MAG TPA: Gfo/Idh/MocA family oxidoreductase [Anaerolineae bacterium]|nr:Gfo/Idh/MocA family oxidoreductase [Anaerolineae bacterium]HOQ97424.1 Gfo/Idh/MocA family oxidoreductase [Anaerolineae bacterium]HPL29460.1 Gfo/Idh/MocA family oxidoreductase [Anaerolineae bacterium]